MFGQDKITWNPVFQWRSALLWALSTRPLFQTSTGRASQKQDFWKIPNLHSIKMGKSSEAHICQCLSLLSTLRRNSIVTVTGNRRKTGKEFVESVMGLAQGLLQLGLCSGEVISIAAFNRFCFTCSPKMLFENTLKVLIYGCTRELDQLATT